MNNRNSPTTLAGLATARGCAAGPVFLYRGDGEIPITEYVVQPDRVDDELQRLRHAQTDVRRDIETLISALRERAGREDVRVFECHLMMLEDPAMNEQAEKLVRDRRLNAESAVRHVVADARAQFDRMNDPYFRERVRDLDDVERRLLKRLTGFAPSSHFDIHRPSIVVADDLTPSETVQLPREFVLGFATNGGSATSHVALIARALGLPAVTGLGDITARVRPGTTILLDGTSGEVTINPDPVTEDAFRRKISASSEETASARGEFPAGTLADGGKVGLCANVHPGVPVDGLVKFGAHGIGLYRSEYLWLDRELAPTENEQFEAYRSAAMSAAELGPDASVTIRTLDIGGDKTMRGISKKEDNPFLGNRSIRYLLSHRDVFRAQLRAILRASAFGRVRIMHPLVSCLEEVRAAASVLDDVRAELAAAGVAFDPNVPVGIMVEVPAAALNAEALAGQVDFFSIGTNDLVQYTMAADRGNEAVSSLYQPLNPAVLFLIRRTLDAARRHGIPVGVCGESAADPVMGTLWAAMGAEELSMSASYIPGLSVILRRLTRADLDEYAAMAEGLGSENTASDVWRACETWLGRRIPGFKDLV